MLMIYKKRFGVIN